MQNVCKIGFKFFEPQSCEKAVSRFLVSLKLDSFLLCSPSLQHQLRAPMGPARDGGMQRLMVKETNDDRDRGL